MFISGATVEVSDTIAKGEVVWVPAIIIKEIDDDDVDDDEDEDEEEEEDGEEEKEGDDDDNDDDEEDKEKEEKKYTVKVCDNPLNCEGINKRPNKTVDKRSIRPRPPPFSVKELKSVEYIEVFHGTSWRQGRVMERMPLGWCKLLLEATNKELRFQISDIRPSKVWEDGVWKFLKHGKSMFISGTMVEVSDKIGKGEIVWVPAVIIKEIDDDYVDKKKYIVKVCNNPFNCEGIKKRPNKTVDIRSVRPRPPPFLAEELKSVEYIEVFHGTSWRQGRVSIMSRGWCKVLFEAEDKILNFKVSDIRPSKVWEDGVWKPRELPLPQGSVDEMGDSTSTLSPVSNSPPITPLIQTQENPMASPVTQGLVDEMSGSGNTFSPEPVTPSPSITATPLIQTRENGTSEDNIRNRKREQKLSSVDMTMVLPFEKMLPIWKTVESMEVFKTFPQSPHFTPLLEIREDAREMSAVGMMLTFSGLLEEVKSLKLNNPIRSLNSLRDSFAELGKHGFDVKVPMLRISKLLSLIDRQAKNMEELEGAEKVTAEKERIKVENERKILELKKLNEEADKEIAQSKSCEATIGQQLEDVKLQFHTTASGPW